jgi:hypothetical protein
MEQIKSMQNDASKFGSGIPNKPLERDIFMTRVKEVAHQKDKAFSFLKVANLVKDEVSMSDAAPKDWYRVLDRKLGQQWSRTAQSLLDFAQVRQSYAIKGFDVAEVEHANKSLSHALNFMYEALDETAGMNGKERDLVGTLVALATEARKPSVSTGMNLR